MRMPRTAGTPVAGHSAFRRRSPVRRAGRLSGALLLGAAMAADLPAASSMAQDTPGGGGISVEEYLRVFPPAPVEVRATAEGEAVVLTWTPPAAAPAREGLAYDPEIAGYRIYRVDGAGGQALVAEVGAEVRRFRDDTAGAVGRMYAVTAVQRSGQESGLSHTVAARRP